MTTFEEFHDRCVWTVRGRKRTATITRHHHGCRWTVEDRRGVIAAAADESSTGETDAQAWERMLAVAHKITSRR